MGFRFILIQLYGLKVVYGVFVSHCSVIVCVINTLMTDMVFRMAPHLLSSTELKFGDFADNPMRCFQAIDRQCDEVALSLSGIMPL